MPCCAGSWIVVEGWEWEACGVLLRRDGQVGVEQEPSRQQNPNKSWTHSTWAAVKHERSVAWEKHCLFRFDCLFCGSLKAVEAGHDHQQHCEALLVPKASFHAVLPLLELVLRSVNSHSSHASILSVPSFLQHSHSQNLRIHVDCKAGSSQHCSR